MPDKYQSVIQFQGNVQLKGNLARKVYSSYTVTYQEMEEIAGLVVEKIDVFGMKDF